MREEIEKAIKFVEDFNEIIFEEEDCLYDEYQLEFFYCSNWCFGIKFYNLILWNSDNDERIYDEKTDEREPLNTFIFKKLKEIGNSVLAVSHILDNDFIKKRKGE